MSDFHVASKIQRNKLVQTLRSMFVWYPSNYSKEERKVLFKLDLCLLIYGCLSFFAKFLDQSNITNAYVSGMKEDLSLFGNELNWLNISYLSGYVLAQVPFLLLMSRPRFSKYVLPTLEIFFGILTFCQSKVTHVNQLYAIRFFVGVCEAPFFAGIHAVFGRMYGSRSYKGNSPELWTRAGTWFLCSSAGSMFSGYLQSAAFSNLSNVGGLKGWQWLFIIDGIITIPISFIGYLFWPGLPESGKPWYFEEKEYKILINRVERNKVAKAGKLDIQVWKRTFSQWKWYVCVFAYICMLMSFYPTGYFSLWLKAQNKYSVPQINNYPTVVNAISIVASFVGSALAAVYAPWKIYLLGLSGQILFGIIMTIYNVPSSAVFFAFYISGISSCCSPILYSTVNRVLRNDQEQKSIVMGSMMSIGYFVYTWAPLGVFPTASSYGERAAPRWKIGYPTQLAFAIVQGLMFLTITYFDRRDRIKNGDVANVEDDVVNDSEEDFDNSSVEWGNGSQEIVKNNKLEIRISQAAN